MDEKNITALLIEDDAEDVFLLTHLMAGPDWPSFRFTLECATDLRSGLECLARGGIEVVLLDLMLPDSHGLDTVQKVRSRFPDVPIVVLTGLSDEALGLQAVARGAQDYQVKGSVDGHALKRTVSYAVERHRMAAELRRLEQLKAEIKERQRMDKLKDELIGAVSHELRNPLTIIKAATCNLRDGVPGPLSEGQAEMVSMLERHVNLLQRIVDNILDLSRLESGKAQIRLERLDAGRLLQDAAQGYRLVARERKLAVNLDVPGGLPPLHADPTLFLQVINNLMDNALRFARTRISLTARAREDSVQVSVVDDGQGIPKERLKDLFGKFVQINRDPKGSGYKGTGLGLALCKEIVERQGGRIWAESDAGRGARFHFTLPRHAPVHA